MRRYHTDRADKSRVTDGNVQITPDNSRSRQDNNKIMTRAQADNADIFLHMWARGWQYAFIIIKKMTHIYTHNYTILVPTDSHLLLNATARSNFFQGLHAIYIMEYLDSVWHDKLQITGPLFIFHDVIVASSCRSCFTVVCRPWVYLLCSCCCRL